MKRKEGSTDSTDIDFRIGRPTDPLPRLTQEQRMLKAVGFGVGFPLLIVIIWRIADLASKN